MKECHKIQTEFLRRLYTVKLLLLIGICRHSLKIVLMFLAPKPLSHIIFYIAVLDVGNRHLVSKILSMVKREYISYFH